jgi:hypothetical protein
MKSANANKQLKIVAAKDLVFRNEKRNTKYAELRSIIDSLALNMALVCPPTMNRSCAQALARSATMRSEGIRLFKERKMGDGNMAIIRMR